MTTTTSSGATGRGAPELDKAFFGHPKGLRTLFWAEMWERFSYYGMRVFLTLFMVAPVGQGGLGFEKGTAGIVYGAYTCMVYLLALPGGWIADRFLGQQKGVIYGGSLIMAGHIVLAIPSTSTFYIGLALVALGTGLLKPNMSAIVGQLYSKDDPRREAGFSIFYMGINIGAFLAPMICGMYLAQSQSFKDTLTSMGLSPSSAWHFAFGSAAVGMALGLYQFVRFRSYLGDAGLHPVPAKDAVEAARNRTILAVVLGLSLGLPLVLGVGGATGIIPLSVQAVGSVLDIIIPATAVLLFAGLFIFGKWTPDEVRRLIVIMVLFLGAVVFFACFEQAGSTLTLFAEERTDRQFFGIHFGSTAFGLMNSAFVVMLAGPFAWMWLKLAAAGKEPSTVTKFGFGLVFVGLGFFILYPAGLIVTDKSAFYYVGPGFLTSLYFVHTVAEMFLSPVGLASMTRLAPQRITGMVLGIWFLGSSTGNYAAGRAVSLTESMATDDFILLMTGVPIALGLVMFALARPIQRMLARSNA